MIKSLRGIKIISNLEYIFLRWVSRTANNLSKIQLIAKFRNLSVLLILGVVFLKNSGKQGVCTAAASGPQSL